MRPRSRGREAHIAFGPPGVIASAPLSVYLTLVIAVAAPTLVAVMMGTVAGLQSLSRARSRRTYTMVGTGNSSGGGGGGPANGPVG